jgi:ubiquinone/menaquinone biosynthesis C-methylase UbiE
LTDYYQRHGKYAAAAWHRRFLKNAYQRSYQALEDLGCSPLKLPRLRVLLCGVGAPATTLEFAAFLCARQLSTRLFVVDVALPPLVASRAALEAESPLADVTFLCADARALPFPDGSFDLVETDFLLQFLVSSDRRAVLHEWARVLRAGGGLMTRDWVTHERGLDPLWDALRRAVLRTVLGVRTHVLTCNDLRGALQEAGFQATLLRLGRMPLIHVIAGVAHRAGE